ncbi:hypothetical protein C8J56DRAFT_898392 [Mycena floridula]|nr:hypothetical protein C8J56DRAFT_898392 [Mycena floridula]
MSEATQLGPLADSDISGLKEDLLIIAVEFVLYGIYSTLVVIVLYKLWTNKAQSTAHHILIAGVISMFVATTIPIFMLPTAYLILLSTLGSDPPNVGRSPIIMDIFSGSMLRLNYLIGDSIVVWRAWVIWTNNSRVHMLLCTCLFGSFVGVTVDWAFGILFDLSELSDSSSFTSNLFPLMVFLPLLWTNLISTLLIAYKIWEYKVEIKQNFGPSHNTRTKVERVLILLTESGTIYCLIWLTVLVFTLKGSDNQSFFYPLITDIVPSLVATYPIIIILLVTLEKANLEQTVNGPSFSQSLQFASRPQVPTATQSDDVAPDSMTSHIDSVMPDSDTDDRLDPTTDDRPDSNTNDVAVPEPLGEKMEKHSSSHLG